MMALKRFCCHICCISTITQAHWKHYTRLANKYTLVIRQMDNPCNFGVTTCIPFDSSQDMYRNVVCEFYWNIDKSVCFFYIYAVIKLETLNLILLRKYFLKTNCLVTVHTTCKQMNEDSLMRGNNNLARDQYNFSCIVII